MWLLTVVATTIALLPCVVQCDVVDDFEHWRVENELELEDEFRRQLHHHHHHHPTHRHRRHKRWHNPLIPFLHRPITSLLMDSTPKDSEDSEEVGPVLPSREHPAVAKQLRGMDHEMHDLKIQHTIASQARNKLEGDVKSAAKHINEVVAIKDQLAHTDIQIRTEERKVKRLEEDRLRLDRTHKNLMSSLHHIMEPKIEFASERLQRKKEELQQTEAKAAEWKSNEAKYHAASLASIEERDRSKEQAKAAEAAEEKAHQDWIMAEKGLKNAKKSTNLNIERYRYSQAEARALATKEKQDTEETNQAEASMNRLNRIYRMEKDRVDESMAVGKDRVRGKIQELEKKEQKSHNKLDSLKQQYAQWQAGNQEWTSHLASTQFKTQFAAQSYANAKKAAFDKASERAVMEAESDTDWAWDDWANE